MIRIKLKGPVHFTEKAAGIYVPTDGPTGQPAVQGSTMEASTAVTIAKTTEDALVQMIVGGGIGPAGRDLMGLSYPTRAATE